MSGVPCSGKTGKASTVQMPTVPLSKTSDAFQSASAGNVTSPDAASPTARQVDGCAQTSVAAGPAAFGTDARPSRRPAVVRWAGACC